MLIDYVQAGVGVAALDPVQLELSLQFHPLGRRVVPALPDIETLDWCSRESCVERNPAPEFVEACRDWAEDVQASPEESWAVAYALALRELRFEAEGHGVALAVLRSVVARLS